MREKEKIMVTGGAGFIGSHIVDLLIEKDYAVIVVDDLSGGKKENVNKQAIFYELNINDPLLENVLAKEKPEYICHQAAQISVSYSVRHPRTDAQQNIMGLLNLLECVHNHPIKGFIFASSGGTVYGEPDTFPVQETHPFYPSSPYGIAKMSSEFYLDFYYRTYGVNYISLRYGNVYGPRQDPHGEAGVIAIFVNKMLNGETPVINGDGEYIRDYVYVKDVAEACLRSIKNVLKLSEIRQEKGLNNPLNAFNIGTGKGTSVNQLFACLQEIIGFSLEAEYGVPRAGDLRRNILDCRMAKEYLGWEAQNDIKDGLKKTVEWFRKRSI